MSPFQKPRRRAEARRELTSSGVRKLAKPSETRSVVESYKHCCIVDEIARLKG
jgi:hypothetical protein